MRTRLVAWYATEKRDLPWRKTRDPYAIWVSETMLQQTRVETVIPYYARFLDELPTVMALAEAEEERVLALWSGLGYYRRARMLHAAARRVAATYGGHLPDETEGLRSLEGIGAYTAGAVASIAFGRRAPVVDGNVTRVLSRFFALEDDMRASRGRARVWGLAEELMAGGEGDPGEWNQALMELGATLCTPGEPKCEACPVRSDCEGRARGVARRLPRMAPKRPATRVSRVAVVLSSSRGVLLARRRVDVLFGGLWEPPSAVGGSDALASLALALGTRPSRLELAGTVRHLLSHRRMHVEVMRGVLGKNAGFLPPSPEYDTIEVVSWKLLPRRAQASLTRKILAVAKVGPLGLR